MTDAPAPEPLDPQRAARLIDFARGCSAAARAVSLYPAGHPAVESAVASLIETAGRVTSAQAFRMTVLPHGLLLDSLAPKQPDQAVPELARLLHQHLISGLVLHDGGDPSTWQTLLSLLGRPPKEIREAGGIGHLWSDKGGLTTVDHRRSIELRQVDYERLFRLQALGDPATLEEIFGGLVSGYTDGLDPAARETLAEIIRDPAKLELFVSELSTRVEGDDGAHAETLVHLLRTAVELVASDEDAVRDDALANLAKMLAGLTAETMADLLRRASTPAAMSGDLNAVETVAQRMTSDDIEHFVSESIVEENGASRRLAEAFQALVPDLDEQRQMVSVVGQQMAESPFGQTDEFPDIWKRTETLLTSYRDEQFVHDQYAHELDSARTQAIEIEEINDDPDERIASWLATVNDPALLSLDLQLLVDLLILERDPFRWRDIAETACGHIETLAQSGDLELVVTLLDGIARERPDDPATAETGTIGSFAVEAINRLVAGPATGHALARLHTGDEGAAAQVEQLCRTLGPGVVMSLAEVLATERNATVLRTLGDILVGFGARGRDAIRQLLDAPDWEVRRTAAVLLRQFGGNEGLDELRQLLTDDEPRVQREALRAIVSVGDERAYQVLVGVLVKGPPRQRATLLQQLTAQRDEQAVPLCQYLLAHVDHRRRQDIVVAAIGTLGAVGGEDTVAPLRDALCRGEWWAPLRTRALRQAAAQALRRTRTQTALQVLSDAAAQGPRGVRAAAKDQLGLIEGRV